MRTKDWWDETLSWVPALTRSDAMWVVITVVIVTLYLKYPINWDAVFGLR